MSIGITLTETKAHNVSSPVSSQSEKDEVFDDYGNLPILLPRLSYDVESVISDEAHPPTTIYYSPLAPQTSPLSIDKKAIEFSDFYSLQAHESDGTPFNFAQLKGKYVLIVNIASMCGFAWQMRLLNELHQKYGNDVVVLGFPSNDFLQEWFSSENAALCYRSLWKCEFKIMEKVRVNGPKEHEVFKLLKDQKKGVLGSRRVKWNFEKFLVDREGRIIRRYSTLSFAGKIMEDLEMILKGEVTQKSDMDNFKMRSIARYKKLGMVHPLQNQEIIYYV